uniref:Uncharacterized protein n=1 Tax=Arundo donax TaxID=35708 RepID=A0A0A9EPR4_ARUDO
MALLPIRSASCAHESSQMQFANMSSSTLNRWNPLPDSGCKPPRPNGAFGQVPNEDVEHKFRYLESSVHKTGMVLDSVQNDVIGLNRAMKDAKLDCKPLLICTLLSFSTTCDCRTYCFVIIFFINCAMTQ